MKLLLWKIFWVGEIKLNLSTTSRTEKQLVSIMIMHLVIPLLILHADLMRKPKLNFIVLLANKEEATTEVLDMLERARRANPTVRFLLSFQNNEEHPIFRDVLHLSPHEANTPAFTIHEPDTGFQFYKEKVTIRMLPEFLEEHHQNALKHDEM